MLQNQLWTRLVVRPAIWLWFVFPAAFSPFPAMAINLDVSLSQLGHLAWRVQDGSLPGTPTAIAQTNDGYLWIGTQTGLVRFDGAVFVPVAPPPDQTPHLGRIAALTAGRDGSLWIGTASQVLHWKEGQFHLFKNPFGFYASIREAPDGRIWAARYHTPDFDGPLCEVHETRLSCNGTQQGIPFKNAGPLAIEDSGAIWIATANKLARWTGGQAQTYAPAELSRNDELQGYKTVVVDPDGSIWSGVISGGAGLGLQHLVHGAWSPVLGKDIDTSTWEVTTLMFDRDRALWVGTASRGIYRISGNRIDHFGVSDGLSANSVSGFCEDHEGNIWVITTKGLDKFRPTQVVTLSSQEGLSADGVNAVLASKSGAVWISNASALEKIDHGIVTSYRQVDGLPGKLPTALFEDAQNRLWVGLDDGVAVFDGKRFNPVRAVGTAVGAIREFAQAPDSTVWAITALLPSHLLRMNGTEVLESIQPPAGRRFQVVAADPDGALWMGLSTSQASCDLARYSGGKLEIFPLHRPAFDGACTEVVVKDAHTVFLSASPGIIEWHDGLIRVLTTEVGLPCGHPHTLVFDRHENLWVYLPCGIAFIESKQLADWWSKPDQKLQIRLLDVSDGALPGAPDFSPRGAVSVDGKIWFANSTDLQYVDPQKWLRNTVIPPVHIETLKGDDRSFAIRSPISLPPLTRNVQIDFTALSLTVPQRVQFKYRLTGWDTDWRSSGNRRQAFYTNLRPGRYHFSVLASNDDGLWNTQGDSLEFEIRPAFYQAWWFRLFCLLVLAALIQCAYLFALRRAKSNIRLRLAAQLSERERIARELHDTLLQSVQGIMLKLHAVSSALPLDSAGRNRLDKILDQGSDVIDEGRARVSDLRGSDTIAADLAAQLGAYGAGFEVESRTAFSFIVTGRAIALNPVVGDELLQIAREAISNAFSHAEAKHIEVELIYAVKTFRLRIRDDGKGMSRETVDSGRRGHWGLLGMRERAKALGGKFNIWSQMGSGTEIDLALPGATAYLRTDNLNQPGIRKWLRWPGRRSV